MDITNGVQPACNWRLAVATNTVVYTNASVAQCVDTDGDPFDGEQGDPGVLEESSEEDDNVLIPPVRDEDEVEDTLLATWKRYSLDQRHTVHFVFPTSHMSSSSFSYSPMRPISTKLKLEFCANGGAMVSIFEVELKDIYIENLGAELLLGKVSLSLPWCDDVLIKIHFSRVNSEVAYMTSKSVEMSTTLKTLAFLVLHATKHAQKRVRY